LAQPAATATPVRAAAGAFEGVWETTFGPVTLTQDQDRVVGTYANHQAHLSGKLRENKLIFTYREPRETGEGWFALAADGQSFRGKYRIAGEDQWHAWDGKRPGTGTESPRGFEGLWNTTFGNLRLIRHDAKTSDGVLAGRAQDDGKSPQEDSNGSDSPESRQNGSKEASDNQPGSQDPESYAVAGLYALEGGSTLEGRVQGRRLVFTYREPQAQGEGWFELAADGRTFHGEWTPAGGHEASTWTGVRMTPVAGRKWLVVLEAHYENDLAEPEYSFGQMLRAFFSRKPEVQVRHRFFHDRRDLRKWGEELAYLNEPVVVVIASHGTHEGISVGSQTIGLAAIAESLRYAQSLRLLHFSSCEIMGSKLAADLSRRLSETRAVPISGYCTEVDWTTSAVIEFMYLDLILARNYSPADAARQVQILMPVAGDAALPGADLPSAGFRLLAPQ
jgi:hypothetical protein